MPLTQLKVHGYRGFREPATLSLATPNGLDGSGLTVVTGPNNAGKSTLLECLRARSGSENASFSTGARNAAVDFVTITYTVNGKEETIKSVTKGSSETERDAIDKEFEIFVVPSRRAFQVYFGRSEFSREEYVATSGLPAQRSSVLTNFEYRLFKTMRNPAAFNQLLAEALGYKPVWTIDRSDQGQYFLKFFSGDASHSSDGMGEGIISLFAIVDALHDSKSSNAIVIDEPELSLHPTLQKRLAQLLRKYARDRQIIVATHSPYFVDLKSLANGAQLAMVKTTSVGTTIKELSEQSRDSIRRLSAGNIYNPHVFGLDARELFFQEDSIVLTEGQEDVLLFPEIAAQLGTEFPGHFFGWGVGGAGNIAHLCQILQDLGFAKVAAVLDGDKTAERTRLQNKFRDYYFVCIPAKDIRTKPERAAIPGVFGLLDEELRLRPEFKSAMLTMIASLSDHMRK